MKIQGFRVTWFAALLKQSGFYQELLAANASKMAVCAYYRFGRKDDGDAMRCYVM